jgi:hypothetical protein
MQQIADMDGHVAKKLGDGLMVSKIQTFPTRLETIYANQFGFE